MSSTLRRSARKLAPCLIASCFPIWIAAAALAQAPTGPPVVRVFHPDGPTLSYDVATIKPSDPNQPYAGTTLRRYIANAYGVPIPWGVPGVEFPGAQVLGGPAWIDNDKYDIKGKAPDELRVAMEKMKDAQRTAQTRTMQQALLAERFHLKVHFETREMKVYELVPAKGGLKIKSAAPVDHDGDTSKPKNDSLSAGSMWMGVSNNGAAILQGRAVSMEMFLNALRGESPDVTGRPIVDMTGFQGKFDLKDFRFSGMPLPGARDPGIRTSTDQDPPPSVFAALEQSLGLKLVPAKGQVEVVIIDSIDRPTEN
jgi:uncharacterized protein (TIGR03435 family)